ncbi:MAG TPA: XrtA system polysaccharide deacetylase [Ignavibacteria bacterium]
MLNALSIDLEDWFCVHNLSSVIKKEDWDKCEYRVEKNSSKILDLLDKYNTKATFFVLGWIAEKSPQLIKEIENRGHEIASHGYYHTLITSLTPEEFESDLKRGVEAIKKTGVTQEILGFRAPSFTIVDKTKWALEILEKNNFKYDSSVFPVSFHPDYGIGDVPLSPYKITKGILEFPMSVALFFGKKIPFGGGGYFRLFPYFITKYLFGKVNREGRPVIFYLHPWEIDPGQPKMKLPMLNKFRHYNNLNKTEKRFDRLLNDFQFTTLKNLCSKWTQN